MTYSEREQNRRELFANPYGRYNYYQLNANNVVIGSLLSEYAKLINMYSPIGDAQRVEFEVKAWSFLCRLYKKDALRMQFDIPKLAVPQKEGITYLSLDPDKHIAKKLFGWRREQLEIFIDDILDKEKTVDLFQKVIEKWMKKKVSE